MKYLSEEYTREINRYINEMIDFVKNAKLSDAKVFQMDDVNRVSRLIDEEEGVTTVKLSKEERAALSMSEEEKEELVMALDAMKKSAYPFDEHRYGTMMEKNAALSFKQQAHGLVKRYLSKANERAKEAVGAPKAYTGKRWKFVPPSYKLPAVPESDGASRQVQGKAKIASNEKRFEGLQPGEMTYSRYSDSDYYETKAFAEEDRLTEIRVTCDDVAKRWSISVSYQMDWEFSPRVDRFEANSLETAARMFSYAGDNHILGGIENARVVIERKSAEKKESKTSGFSGVFGKKNIERNEKREVLFDGTVEEVLKDKGAFSTVMKSEEGKTGLFSVTEMARSLRALKSSISAKAETSERSKERDDAAFEQSEKKDIEL